MRTRLFFVAAVVLVGAALLFSVRAPRAAAQETMMHTCDSTLITLLLIAEHDYGFHPMSVDAATLDKGQFAPLFDAMMAEMAMMTPEPDMMTPEAMTEGDMMMTMEPMEGMMMLAPGNIEGEDPLCTTLRAELEAFFYAHYSMDMMP
jgi:hypothetical protein